jgi:hypothetical protein
LSANGWVTDNKIGPVGAKALASVLGQCEFLETFYIHCMWLIGALGAHSVAANRIDVEGTKSVAAVLPSMTRLRHVFMCGTIPACTVWLVGLPLLTVLTGIYFGVEGAKALAASLPACLHLQELFLTCT